MIGMRLQWNLQAFQARMTRFAQAVGKDAGVVVREQAKLFGKDLVKLTPPFKSWSAKESFNEQRKVGMRRVQIDIRGAFRGLDLHPLAASSDLDVREAWLKAVRGKDYFALEVLHGQLKMDPPLSTHNIIDQVTPEAHNKARGSRGRVRRSAFKYPTWVPKTENVKRFVKRKQKDVGKAKGGWTPGVSALGVSLPAWIKRQAKGRFVDKTNDPKEPSFIFVNSCSYIGYLNKEGRFVSEAMKRRNNAMERQIEAKLQGRWRESKKLAA